MCLRECVSNLLLVVRTIDILKSLGFYIKIEKAEIITKQHITFLGGIIDSLHMTITLTNEKNQRILKVCTASKLAHTLTIRGFAKLTGNVVGSMEAVSCVQRIFYIFVGNLKETKLNHFNRTDNFQAKITLSDLYKIRGHLVGK